MINNEKLEYYRIKDLLNFALIKKTMRNPSHCFMKVHQADQYTGNHKGIEMFFICDLTVFSSFSIEWIMWQLGCKCRGRIVMSGVYGVSERGRHGSWRGEIQTMMGVEISFPRLKFLSLSKVKVLVIGKISLVTLAAWAEQVWRRGMVVVHEPTLWVELVSELHCR